MIMVPICGALAKRRILRRAEARGDAGDVGAARAYRLNGDDERARRSRFIHRTHRLGAEPRGAGSRLPPHAETGGAVLLLAAVAAALLWANSPWWESYESFWTTDLSIKLGSGDLPRSASLGERGPDDVLLPRRRPRGQARARHGGAARAAAPRASRGGAALGGMAVPVAIFLAFNAGGSGAHGWGAAMSTDTALALGVLGLLAPRGYAAATSAADARDRRRPGGAARDRDRLHGRRLVAAARDLAIVFFLGLIALRYAPIAWRGRPP